MAKEPKPITKGHLGNAQGNRNQTGRDMSNRPKPTPRPKPAPKPKPKSGK